MGETINVTIRLDKDIKEQAEKMFSDFGMNLSTAFNIFARQALRQSKIPFEIGDPLYSWENKSIEIKDDDINTADEFKKDSALKPAVETAIELGQISTSILQTKLSLGYARAARIINIMEKMNIIGPFENAKPRKVLITKEEFAEMTANID